MLLLVRFAVYYNSNHQNETFATILAQHRVHFFSQEICVFSTFTTVYSFVSVTYVFMNDPKFVQNYMYHLIILLFCVIPFT